MKRLIFLLTVFVLLACGAAGADPAKTDGTVTAWIGEDNNYYMILADGQPRRLTAPMKDILTIDETDVTALTQDGQLITVKKDGSSFSQLSLNATEEEIEARRDRTFQLTEGKLTVGETVFSERAAVAATDGLVLYWVNAGDNGYVLMHKELPGKEQQAFGRAPVSLTGKSVPEPLYLCVTAEALTLTAKDHSILCFNLKTGETQVFPASGQETAGACMVDNRLYRYTATETLPWQLETILNDAMQLETVTPAPTAVPTAAPRTTLVPTAAPQGGGSSSQQDDGNIYKGASGRTVRKIQQQLRDLGYPVGAVDGSYGIATEAAVIAFQQRNGLTADGKAGTATLNRVYGADAIRNGGSPVDTATRVEKEASDGRNTSDISSTGYSTLEEGSEGSAVRTLQERLKKLGYYNGSVDGRFGEGTSAAVMAFQLRIS